MMENRVSNSKANATYQNSSKVKEVAYRIFAAVANAILVVLGGGLLDLRGNRQPISSSSRNYKSHRSN